MPKFHIIKERAASFARRHFPSFFFKPSPLGGTAMIGKDELNNFKKMWAWLIGYPAHDREYYMEHVVKNAGSWNNNCPLSTSSRVENCNGCQLLWNSNRGTLCTDPGAPLYKWINTERHLPDERSYYASLVAVLSMKAIRKFE